MTKDVQCDLNEQSSTGFISQIYVQPSDNVKHKVFHSKLFQYSKDIAFFQKYESRVKAFFD